MELSCTTQEFARRNEVTIRALRYYDRLGLLSPRRSASGYRRYSTADAERLQQILALRWAGLSLKEIGRLLNDESADISEALHRRRLQLEETRQKLDRVLSAIQQAGLISSPGNAPDPKQRAQTINVIGLNWAMTKIHRGGEVPGFPEKLREWKGLSATAHSAEEIEEMRRESADLFRDAEAVSEQDPAGTEGRSIAARYRRLIARQTQGNPELLASTLELHRQIPVFPDALGLNTRLENFSNKAWVFIGKALTASR